MCSACELPLEDAGSRPSREPPARRGRGRGEGGERTVGCTLRCQVCRSAWHRACLKSTMPASAHPGGFFTCVPCFVWQSSHQLGHTPSAVAEQELWRLSNDVQCLLVMANAPGTPGTYMSSLTRFTGTLEAHFEFPPAFTLPREEGKAVEVPHVMLFLAAARGRWKTATIEGTMAALKWWHKDKGMGQGAKEKG